MVLISCNHKKKPTFRFFQFPCLNNFVGTYRSLAGPLKVNEQMENRWVLIKVLATCISVHTGSAPNDAKETQDAWLAGI